MQKKKSSRLLGGKKKSFNWNRRSRTGASFSGGEKNHFPSGEEKGGTSRNKDPARRKRC